MLLWHGNPNIWEAEARGSQSLSLKPVWATILRPHLKEGGGNKRQLLIDLYLLSFLFKIFKIFKIFSHLTYYILTAASPNTHLLSPQTHSSSVPFRKRQASQEYQPNVVYQIIIKHAPPLILRLDETTP